MIQFSLKCADGHQFDSWFQSAAAFDALKKAGHLSCTHCGNGAIEKAIMAPRVQAARAKAAPVVETPEPQAVPQVTPGPDVQKALAAMKKQVEANSDYVGEKFADEARAMHLGDVPERAIYGQANAADAKALIEDGVPVLPLPFTPTRKTN